ncbi:hypothetical protein BJY54_001111 [Streptomyces nodosus]|nr:hypothetical protein [Streptomyces nodosus]
MTDAATRLLDRVSATAEGDAVLAWSRDDSGDVLPSPT